MNGRLQFCCPEHAQQEQDYFAVRANSWSVANVQEAALTWVNGARESEGWSHNVGLFFHVYGHNSSLPPNCFAIVAVRFSVAFMQRVGEVSIPCICMWSIWTSLDPALRVSSGVAA